MTGPEAAVEIVKYIGGGIGALFLYLAIFTDFFDNVSRGGREVIEKEIEVTPQSVIDNVRNVIDDMRSRIDRGVGASQTDITKWERDLVEALMDE